MARAFRRTIEDVNREKDSDYQKAMNSHVAWSERNRGNGVSTDIHTRRYNSVIKSEREKL